MIFENHDKGLFNQIKKLVDIELAEKITKICLKWTDEQIDWGGKYDYLLEQAWGEDA